MIRRRDDINRNTPAELAIRQAIRVVESLRGDHRLTWAVDFLDKARVCVADFVDEPIPEHVKTRGAVVTECRPVDGKE